ncbi:MAG: 4-(cytidine 5'-diphospho)-2-C-methyl-D-erythritol kinase [Deltaproteobacteria bacterium]|nr:4-(cytidine 5'-diphospho)-2-C-methyl-D-erythritol kinase [Deltaproteobacteria bacterium]
MIRRLSPAKVNLHLRVMRKREDGYHDILTLMQRISLYDEMLFSPIEHGITVTCPDSTLPENEENIVYRAAKTFFSHTSCPRGIHITIRKSIPVAAGLGGGSSNAATTLMALNEMQDLPCTTDDLMKMGSTLGADVPFFIFGKTAWATGIGDHFQSVEKIPSLWFVLVTPSFEVSTKMVYDKLNFRLTKRALKYKNLRLYTVEDLVKALYNDLEKVTLNLYPILQQLKELLLKQGAHGALMSGSGPTVFGIFTQEKKASKAEAVLREMGTGAWSVFRAHQI